jgi:hypothetical protein
MENTEEPTEIVLRDPRVCAFYATHAHISADKVNAWFVDMMEKMVDNASPSVSALADIAREIHNVRAGILAAAAAAPARRTEDVRAMSAAITDTLRLTVADAAASNNSSIISSVRDAVRGANDTALATLFAQVDGNVARAVAGAQAALSAGAAEREARVGARLDEVRTLTARGGAAAEQLCGSVADLLKKMENSSCKGRISETMLYNTLVQLFPSAHVDHVCGMKETGDIIVRRKGRAPVLVENKCYDRNVSQEEVNKFYRDIEAQDMNGLFVSQRTGIVGKTNFEIELRDGNVLIFLHNVEYDADKIKVAFDVLDNVRAKLDDIVLNNSEAAGKMEIDQAEMESVNQEYQDFCLARLNHIRTIKESAAKMLLQVDTMRMPNLGTLLTRHFTPMAANKEHVCEFCLFTARNARALSAHLRGCAVKKKNKERMDAPPTQTTV